MRTCMFSGCVCHNPAPLGLGWGLGSGLVEWFCPAHYLLSLARLAGLLDAVGAVA